MVAPKVSASYAPHPRPSLVSVVLAVRNGMPEITEQLEALAAQELDVPWELVVADNGSSDATVAEVARFEGRVPRLVVVDASARPGQQFARRCGVTVAAGELVACCDHDDVVAPGWLQALVDASSDFDAVGGALELTTLNDAQLINARQDLREWEVRLPKFSTAVPYPGGANWAIWRRIYVEIDEPDRDLPPSVGGEDVETGCRLRRAGRSLGFAPRARVAYRLRASTRETFQQLRAYGRGASVIAARYPDLVGVEPSLVRTSWLCLALAARAAKARLEGDDLHWSRRDVAYELGRLEGSLRIRFWRWGR